jgi:hypothetical protein
LYQLFKIIVIGFTNQMQIYILSRSVICKTATVGAMDLARAMELACSLSNEILVMFHKESRPDFLLLEALLIYNRFLKKYFEICFKK